MKKIAALDAMLDKNCSILRRHSEKLATLYRNCYLNTLNATITPHEDGTCYLLAGDIPAMWLRDSSTQVWGYLPFAKDPDIAAVFTGLLRMQFRYINMDPYANAFNEQPSGRGHTEDLPKNSPWVWERKYEIDSLAYPLRLLYFYWKSSGDESLLRDELPFVLRTILNIWKTEQHHFEKSDYRFIRETDRYNDTIHNDGMGEPVGYTGMTWQGFRPSDDACTYGYNIPSNLFAWLALGYAKEMLEHIYTAHPLTEDIDVLRAEILDGVKKFGIIEHEKYGKMFAYETDGLGHYELMDDANIPSLISLPYIGFNDPAFREVYENTRRFILSTDNPYYYVGKAAKGLGSPHEYTGYIWHLGLSIQGLTATDKAEMKDVLETLISTDADTGFMHECFDKDDPTKFRRPFFPWSNMLFCEFVDKCIKEGLFD